ncbi:MAG: RpiB/LacA/LacB family sugar-phosphate isomerase [Candidatus Thorarchaeota archaeon]|jgi:ribose 5-phosphate isomerase B
MDRSKIYIASDHNGNAARNYIKKCIERDYLGELIDLGPHEYDGKVDYVDYASALCERVLEDNCVGILICGTGTGMSIAANRFCGIRAALCTDRATAELSREHNNANVLVMGQWRNSLDQMEQILFAWLTTDFGEERHIKRLEKLDKL